MSTAQKGKSGSGLNMAKKGKKRGSNQPTTRNAQIEQVLGNSENKTDAERALEESLFGKDIIHDRTASTLMADFLVQADEEIDFAIDTSAAEKVEIATTGPVWHDDDDDDLEIDLSETNRLKKLKLSKVADGKEVVTGAEFSKLLQERFQPNKQLWASRNIDEQTDDVLDQEDFDLLNQAQGFTQRRKHDRHMPLPTDQLSLKRLADATVSEPSSSGVTATHFHPNSELFLVASEDKHVKVFKIDEEKNEKQIGVRFKDVAIRSAKFLGNDGEIVVSGRKPYYYVYDATTGHVTKLQLPVGSKTKTLESMEVSPLGTKIAFLGTEGYVHIADGRSKQWVADLKMNCTSRAMCFLDEQTCVTSGFDADLYTWDLRFTHRPRCVSRFHHEDGTPTASLAAFVPPSMSSFHNRAHNVTSAAAKRDFYCLSNCFLGVSTLSGVSSVFEGLLSSNSNNSYYSFAEGNNTSPKPIKTIMNLTTKISASAFHPSGQILALASNEKKDQLKLVHVPTCTVFNNWPTSSTPLHKVETVEFSPNGKYMTVGNQRGKVLLFKLNHFAKN